MTSVPRLTAVDAEHGCMISAIFTADHRSRGSRLMSCMLTQPTRRPLSTTGKHAVVVAVDVVVDQLGDADPAGTATALPGHNAPHRHATQAFANHNLLVGRLGRGVHEQADQGVPNAAHEIAGQSLPDAERDGQDAERPADP